LSEFKFRAGQEVIFSKGKLKDVRGKIVNPRFQMSQSDPEEVIIEQEDGTGIFVDIDNVRPAEDPYEYAAVRVDLEDNAQLFLGGTYYDPECWGTLEEAEKLIKEALNDKHYDEWKEDTELQINRRRKAGPVVGYKTFAW
jgi:hypothetical protein